jgi:hypothetical protein
MKRTDINLLSENYNNCTKSITDLKYTQLMVLFKINHISHRTLLFPFLLKRGYIINAGTRATYTSLRENHIPVIVPANVFDDFAKYVKKYSAAHAVKKPDKKPALGTPLPDIIEKQDKVQFPASQGDEKFKLVKEVFGNSQISDESKKTLLEVLNVKL